VPNVTICNLSDKIHIKQYLVFLLILVWLKPLDDLVVVNNLWWLYGTNLFVESSGLGVILD